MKEKLLRKIREEERKEDYRNMTNKDYEKKSN